MTEWELVGRERIEKMPEALMDRVGRFTWQSGERQFSATCTVRGALDGSALAMFSAVEAELSAREALTEEEKLKEDCKRFYLALRSNVRAVHKHWMELCDLLHTHQDPLVREYSKSILEDLQWEMPIETPWSNFARQLEADAREAERALVSAPLANGGMR